MVERTQSQGFEEFEGVVKSVEVVPSGIPNDDGTKANQYKVTIQTPKTRTGFMYTWIKIPATATDTSIPQDSNLDKYIKAIERIDSSVKKIAGHADAMKWLVGKELLFSREKLGKAYKGKEPGDIWVPIRII
jgi:hypothetical protein